MSVYVDPLVKWSNKRPFHNGSCHLTADSDEELHAFAARIGMKREWFQPHPLMNHYDLTPRRRAAAVKLGAIEETRTESVLRRRAMRAKTAEAAQ